jgi:thiamine phosphate synthase YjbQ (UPF0047 family)
MRAHRSACQINTSAAPDFVDITEEIDSAVARSGIREGQVTLFAGEESCSLLVQERESGLFVDIEHTMSRLGASTAPRAGTLVGSTSVVLPVVEGRLRLGVWQRVLLVELGTPRARSVTVQIMGE